MTEAKSTSLNKLGKAIAWALPLCVAAYMAFRVIDEQGAFDTTFWTRENPLQGAIQVHEVRDGVLKLVDGRSFRPAGVWRGAWMTTEQFDSVLSVMAAQGVVIDRDVGDGSAFMTVEPKFYNWCGTRGCGGRNRHERWAGGYFVCPMSYLLIQACYADPDVQQAGLSATDQWRLQGTNRICERRGGPNNWSQTNKAFRYDVFVRDFANLDETIEREWKPRPVDAVGRDAERAN
ncbi:MAG: hypothetical protein JSS51_09630 [Planctomycetes bacterium]|nr:hypothetical protein [Planctomycetota bacterium]